MEMIDVNALSSSFISQPLTSALGLDDETDKSLVSDRPLVVLPGAASYIWDTLTPLQREGVVLATFCLRKVALLHMYSMCPCQFKGVQMLTSV